MQYLLMSPTGMARYFHTDDEAEALRQAEDIIQREQQRLEPSRKPRTMAFLFCKVVKSFEVTEPKADFPDLADLDLYDIKKRS